MPMNTSMRATVDQLKKSGLKSKSRTETKRRGKIKWVINCLIKSRITSPYSHLTYVLDCCTTTNRRLTAALHYLPLAMKSGVSLQHIQILGSVHGSHPPLNHPRSESYFLCVSLATLSIGAARRLSRRCTEQLV